MNMAIIQNALTEMLVNFALAVITLAGGYGVYYIRLGAGKLRAQTAKIADDKARQLLENAVADVTGLATLSVGAMEQTAAKTIREAVKAGTADRSELLALGEQVFREVKDAIAPETQRVISKNLGNFDQYLRKCIEDAVLKVKQNDPFVMLPEGVVVEGGAPAQ